MSPDALKETLWCCLLLLLRGEAKFSVKKWFCIVIKEITSFVSSCLTLSFSFVETTVKFKIPESDWPLNELA